MTIDDMIMINDSCYNCFILWGKPTNLCYVNKKQEMVTVGLDDNVEDIQKDICTDKIYNAHELMKMVKEQKGYRSLDEVMGGKP